VSRTSRSWNGLERKASVNTDTDATVSGRTAPVVERVPIAALLRGQSPRSAGEVTEHTRLLAESAGVLPPILVHRPSMRVIDGMHRLGAAKLRGEETVSVEFFDGDEAEAFVLAVKANITHGLPLTGYDREAAVTRLLELYPQRSDRWIAGVAGLGPGMVAAIRSRVFVEDAATAARIGRDGKVRPLNSAGARRVASQVIAERPEASLREVARLAGLSPATVRDVRDRMRRGDDPVPPRERDRGRGRHSDPVGAARVNSGAGRRNEPRDTQTLLQILNRDPALRFNESGRSLLRWLAVRVRGGQDWADLVDSIPPHCAYIVAELAMKCAEEWTTFAGRLEERLRDIA
jgi:hypothetical protein